MKRIMNKGGYTLYLFFLLCGTCFYSCKVGKNYVKPEFELPVAYQVPDSAVHLADSIMLPWSSFFDDTVLVELLHHAIAHNFDMQGVLKDVAIADQYFKRSKAAFAPTLDADILGINRQYRSQYFYSNPSSGWYDQSGTEPPPTMYNYQSQFYNSLQMSWELDIWGKLRRQKEAAKADYFQNYETRKLFQTNLVAQIAEDYYYLLMLDEQLEVARRNFHFRDSTLRMVALQYEAGEVTALAVQQTRAQVLVAAALIPQLEKEIEIQENALKLITGALPAHIPRSAQLSAIQQNTILTNLPLYLVQNRPDVLRAEYELVAANANVGVAQAYRYPNLTISLTGGLNAMLPQNWFNLPGALFGGLVTGLSQPLLNKRKLKTDYEVAQLQRDKAEIDFQKSVYEAVVETENALLTINKLQEQLLIAEEQVRVAQEAVGSADLLFKAGFATYLEVITAQSNVLDSELNLVTLKANILSARVQLYRALGGGWK